MGEEEQERRGVRGLAVSGCPAPRGTELFVVDNGGQIWPVLGWRGRLWSLAPAMVRHAPGENLSLGPPPPAEDAARPPKLVEWWIREGGEPGALTFRASWQEPGNPGAWRSRLIVVRLSEDGVCVLGAFDGAGENERARSVASSRAACPEEAAPAPPPG